MSRKVDPIHFFNERGVSILSMDHLDQRMKELEEENETLRRINTSLLRRLQAMGASEDEESATSLDS